MIQLWIFRKLLWIQTGSKLLEKKLLPKSSPISNWPKLMLTRIMKSAGLLISLKSKGKFMIFYQRRRKCQKSRLILPSSRSGKIILIIILRMHLKVCYKLMVKKSKLDFSPMFRKVRIKFSSNFRN